MRVARVEAVGDAPTGPVQRDVLTPDRPLAGEGPVIDAQVAGDLVDAARVTRDAAGGGEVLGAPMAEVRLGRAQMVPVGLRLHAQPFDGHGLALDAEQLLDDALRLLVAS